MSSVHFLVQSIIKYRARAILAVVMVLGVTLLTLLPPLILAAVVDQVIGKGRYALLGPLMILSLALPWVSGLMQSIGNYSVIMTSQRIVFDMRLTLYRAVQNLSVRYLQNTPTGKLMERLRGDIEQVQTIFSGQMIGLASQLVTALIAVIVMFWLSWQLTLIVIFGVSMYVVNYKWFVRRIRTVQKRVRSKMDRLSGRAQERLAGSIVVQAYNSQRAERRMFTRANFLTERVHHRFRQLNNAYGMSSSALTWATFATVQLFGTYLVIRGNFQYGTVIAVSSYTWRLLQPAVQLAELSNQLEQTKISLDRIVELIQAERDFTEKAGKKLPELRGQVTFDDLSFQYEPDTPVLKNINLDVQPGQIVAFVGETGCGKSTSISLIYHYYKPVGGRLLIDGHDINDLDTRWYRNHLAMVPQDPIVLDDTLANNIAYGDPNASIERIEKAAKMAELSSIIERLPNGVHTLLGEEGSKLSVGERQRLCIARAILKDPTILILDEATSSLDPQSEALIQKALNRVMENRTTFIIAHRLSTIVHADIIVVLDKGRILEQGTHAQLMSNSKSRYRHLFTTQMASTTAKVKESA
ncbi:MAG TPA: hypothetical protein DER01_18100 [Phycisphaerales bacterium]|nr:hypothetical protein [Phycisphaerales bacterium]|tara:strand:- start:47507 stop:49255 length:1749 start_codon:yes stop_codon:yes gene_type:complete